jgi:hypothetical protein
MDEVSMILGSATAGFLAMAGSFLIGKLFMSFAIMECNGVVKNVPSFTSLPYYDGTDLFPVHFGDSLS